MKLACLPPWATVRVYWGQLRGLTILDETGLKLPDFLAFWTFNNHICCMLTIYYVESYIMLDDITGQGGRFRRTMQLLDNTDKKEVGNACFPLIFLGVVVVLAAYIGPNRTVTTTTWERQYCNYRATIIKHMFYFGKHRGKQIGLNLNGRTFQSFLH